MYAALENLCSSLIVMIICPFGREEVLEACRVQRTRFEVARGRKQRAREAADLLLVSLYCHIPPSRGLEMRTLEFLEHDRLESPFSAKDFRGRNVALLESDGSVSVHIQLYKTAKFAGHDQVKLEVSQTPPLIIMYLGHSTVFRTLRTRRVHTCRRPRTPTEVVA